jgi:hypothetical protein
MTDGERQAVEMLDCLCWPSPSGGPAIAAMLGAVIGGCLPLLEQEKRLRIVRLFDQLCQQGVVSTKSLLSEIKGICREETS